ncbi:hypothetical protein Tco_1340703, partial [Tanacetum coccineum]
MGIRHHFIRDCNAKKLIQIVKIDTAYNVADLLTKGFDAGRQKCPKYEQVKRGRDTKVPQSGGPLKKVGDEAIHKELSDRIERAATTASSLEAEQDSDAQTRFEAASKSPITYLSQEKPEGSEGFHHIIDFLNASHIQTSANREIELTTTIDGQVKTLTEASLRIHLKLEDNDIPLFPTMIIPPSPSLSPSRITSSPSLSSQTYPSTSPPPSTQPTLDAKEPVSMPHDSPLQSVHSLERDEGSMQQNELTNLVTKLTDRVTVLENDLKKTKQTYSTALIKLILRVKKLEKIVKTTKAKRRARIVVSEDEDAPEDSSKQRRKISDNDEDPNISLVQDDGITCTASEIGSTVGVKAKDKGKAIMTEPEPEKKTKLQQRQERASLKVAIRLEEQLNEEETQRIARDAEIAKQLQEEIDKARQEQEVVAKADSAQDIIDWSDPSVIRYHALQNRPRSVAEVRKKMCIYLKNQGGYKMKHFKGMSYDDIRPIFEKVWDQIHNFVPMDSELELKRGGQEEPAKKQDEEEIKLEDDAEKEELQFYLNIVSEDKGLDVESLAT